MFFSRASLHFVPEAKPGLWEQLRAGLRRKEGFFF
jgi:hypothetical protein